MQPGCTKRVHYRRMSSSGDVEKELTGRESEPWEIIYFKLYKTQIPVIEQAFETAALMLGTDKSRGYCLEMICAEAGANLENEDPTALLQSMSRFFKFLPGEQRQAFLHEVTEKASRSQFDPSDRACALIPNHTIYSENRFSAMMAGVAKSAVPDKICMCITSDCAVQQGDDDDLNLITLCTGCHEHLQR